MEIPEILADIAAIVKKKDADYGRAFDMACANFGNSYAASKIFEKMCRIVKLTKCPPEVESEALEDSLRDCIGYCALYLRRLSQEKGE